MGRLKTYKAKLDPDICVNAVIYGMTGAGKTTLLGTAEECKYTSPTLFMAVDPGTLSIAGSNINVTRPNSFAEIQDIYDYLRYDNDKYQSVCIDSITVTQRTLSMYGIIGVLDEMQGYSKIAETVPPDRYDWLSSGEQMRRFISAFRELAYLEDLDRRIHVFFAAMEKVDDKTNVICPALPGVQGVEVGGSVDMLARLTVERVELKNGNEKDLRHLLLKEIVDENGLKVLAKVRSPWKTEAPEEIWAPTIDKILKTWFSLRRR